MLERLPFGFIIPSHCTPEKLALAKAFRGNPTPQEAMAWEHLRRRGIGGWHFRRQQVIEGFIVDFFCAKLRLVIEVDGEVHDRPDVVEYDRWRDEVLEARGLRVERVQNADLSRERLAAVVEARAKGLDQAPPPARGGGSRGRVSEPPDAR